MRVRNSSPRLSTLGFGILSPEASHVKPQEQRPQTLTLGDFDVTVIEPRQLTVDLQATLGLLGAAIFSIHPHRSSAC